MDILVIDNDKTSREVIGFLIEEEGHTMQAVSWSPRVLDRLRINGTCALHALSVGMRAHYRRTPPRGGAPLGIGKFPRDFSRNSHRRLGTIEP